MVAGCEEVVDTPGGTANKTQSKLILYLVVNVVVSTLPAIIISNRITKSGHI